MKTDYSSETSIKQAKTDPNAQICDNQSENISSKSSRQTSQRQSSIGKNKPLVRKPNIQNSNLQSYKSIKRKSQQKLQNSNMDAPPRYPKAEQEMRMSEGSTKVNSNQQNYTTKSASVIRQSSNQYQDQIIKFKKKPLTKKQIIEIKDQAQEFLKEESEINSVAGTEQLIRNKQGEPPLMKQLNKKSKTQYFHIQDIHKQLHGDSSQGENFSQSDRNYIISLKQKCKSVDQNNSLLQKRVSWLRQEVQMHLQRQLKYQKQKIQSQKDIIEKQNQLKLKQALFLKEKQLMKKQIQSKDLEIQKLKTLFIDLHNKFQDEKELLLQQNDFLKAQIEQNIQQKQKTEEKFKQIQQKYERLLEQKKQIQFNSLNATQQYSKSFIQKLLSENKYLKVENHILAKCKQDIAKLQKQLKRIANQRDNLKKKIIESAKREIKRYRSRDEEQSSDSSQIFLLSQISTPSVSFKKQ